MRIESRGRARALQALYAWDMRSGEDLTRVAVRVWDDLAVPPEERKFAGGIVRTYAGSRKGLLHRVAGEEPEPERYVRIARRFRETARGFTGDVIEMRRVPANNRAEGDDCVVSLGGHGVPDGNRELPRTGNPEDVYVIELHLMADESVERPVHERSGYGLVEAADDDCNAPACASGTARKLSHSGCEQVPELIPFRVEIAGIFFGGRWYDCDPVLDFEAIAL